MDEALFVSEDDGWLPTEHARGPWYPEALHGGPVAALLARALEQVPSGGTGPFHTARVTVELLRPVGVAQLSLSSSLARPGRKVQLVEVEARQAGAPVARARAVRIRTAAVAVPEAAADPAPGETAPPGPDRGRRVPAPRTDRPGFHHTGAELRFVAGSFTEPGPATVWVRLAVPVVPGEAPSALQRAVGAADFGNGVASPLAFGEYLFINPDLTVYLSRPPVGEWVALEARMSAEPTGVGLAQSRLWDTEGVVGRSLQSLLVEAE
ncbi:MAG TPA: thioesterase family protein [Acidimicrobiales bacterium]|nr:thioesterase family protein [Acidimicrobiales bacterium]